ncbi:MAG: translocation/assembly module TamB domain-containing protein [Pseudomonadota bacterium]
MRALFLICFCVFFLPSLVLAQDDEDGGGFLTRTIEGALSGAGREVKLVGFEGALSSEATFERLTIADANGIWLTLEDVALNWSRLALVRGRLQVDSLTAKYLQLTRLPETEEEEFEVPAAEAEEFKLELPDLPVSINIAAFEVSEIELGEPIIGVPTRLNLKAAVRLDNAGLNLDLSADRLDEVAGRFGLRANVERDGSEIDLDLTLDEDPGGIAARLMNLPGLPDVDLKVAGLGPLDDFTADIELSTEGQTRLAGQVELKAQREEGMDGPPDRRILADIGGNITPLIAPDYESFFGPDVGLELDTVLLADGAIDVQEFSLSAQAVDLQGTVRLNTDKWPSFVDIEGRIAQDGTDVVLPGSDNGVSVRDITLDVDFDAAEGDALAGDFRITNLAHEAVKIGDVTLGVDGTLDGTVNAIGRLVANIQLDARGVELADDVAAEALGDTIRASTRITYEEDAPIEIADLTLVGPDIGIDGDIVIAGLDNGFPTDLNVVVKAADLSRFAGLVGQSIAGAAELSVEGSVTPLSSMFDLTIAGKTQDIALGIPQADGVLQGQTNISLKAERNQDGTFVKDLVLKNPALDVVADVALRSSGSEVVARAGLSDVALVVPQYEGAVLLKADARQTEEGWWQIETDLDAPYDSRVQVSGLATGPDADLNFEVSVPEVQPLLPTAQGPLDAQGRLWQAERGYRVDVKAGGPFGVDLDVEGLATGPDARVNLIAKLPDMGVLIPELTGALALSGEVARSGAEDWAVDTQIEGPSGMAADIAGVVAGDASTLDLTVAGQIPLALAGPFVQPRSVTGPVSFDLAVKGAPALEAVSGRITTADVRFSDPSSGFGLQNITTRVDLAQSAAQLDVTGDITTGGRLDVRGNVNLASLVGDIAIGLRNATLIDPSLYEASLEADVTVKGPLAGGARIAGDINLSEVNVTVPATGSTAIGSIPKISHVGASGAVISTQSRAGVLPKEDEKAGNSNAPAYPLALNVNAPSRIFIRGRGLNAEMGGGLQIRGDTNNIVSAGSFDLIRGRFIIIGKRFDLDEGSVQFQGSTTPYIKFVTTTEVPDGTASISVEGEADDPEIIFSAVPEVPEDEVLALILFGRYVSELSAFQALQLANGVAQLTGRGGFDVLGNFREGIGLDELNVATDEAGTTSVSAGKYITDTIYTDVTTNNEKGTDISLNIDLTSDLKGKATVAQDGDSSIGLFFERDY